MHVDEESNRMKHIALVFRHGDRSPTFNAMEPLAVESALEAATWALSLPTRAFCVELEKRFPIESHHAQTRDEMSLGKTFGSLTGLGVLQMRRLGQWVAARSKAQIQPKRILSSNFRRTQFSAQCLLAGLAKTDAPLPVVVAKDAADTLNVWGRECKEYFHASGSLVWIYDTPFLLDIRSGSLHVSRGEDRRRWSTSRKIGTDENI
jgi:Histidine phosphatase superfamily (branch 2)